MCAVYLGNYMAALVSILIECCGTGDPYAHNVFWELYGGASVDSYWMLWRGGSVESSISGNH